MREKSETDALIDELLREFSSDNSQNGRSYREKRQSAVKTPEKKQDIEVEESISQEYTDESTDIDLNSVSAEDNDEYNEYISRRYKTTRYSDEKRRTAERKNANTLENIETDEAEYENSGENINLNINKIENSDEFDDEFDDDDYDEDEFDDDYDDLDKEFKGGHDENKLVREKWNLMDKFEKNHNNAIDFNRFMDSENDGEKGDASTFLTPEIIKIVLKILVLAVFGAFAVVGVINTINIFVSRIESSNSDKGETLKDELQSVIYPLIVTETIDFEHVSGLTSDQLVNICIWEIVINGDISVFKDDNSDSYVIPQDQIEYIVEKLFGEDAKINHTSSEIGNIVISYDKLRKNYIVPKSTSLFTYYPVVTDVSEVGSEYMVYADCYTSMPSWNKNSKSMPSKRVLVTLSKTSEYYNINSLKTVPLE